MNCEEAADRLRRALPELHGLVEGIPHGFTREDFEGPAPRRDDDAFRIVHTGNLHTQLGLDHLATHRIRTLLRGTSLDVDILPRSLKYLLEAIERLAVAKPQLAARIELHLAGNLTPADQAIADRHPFIHAHGQLPHADTIALSRSADLLFVPMHDLPRGRRATIVPCKTYEYLAAGPPILAAVPDGDARDLLERFDRASVVRPRDADGMTEVLAAALEGAGPARDDDGLDSPLLAPYERYHLVGRVAGVLDSVLGVVPESQRLAA
jgi:glycosyltransferase involved in cell wall biosynthesis